MALGTQPGPLTAQNCSSCGGIYSLGICLIPGTETTEEPACNGIINCVEPQLEGPYVEAIDQGNGSFQIRFTVDVRSPFNSHPDAFSNGKLDMVWRDGTHTGGFFGDICENNVTDRTRSWVNLGSASCSSVPVNKGTWTVRAQTCGGPGATCGHWQTVTGTAMVTSWTLGCLPPLEWACPNDGNSCNPSCVGPGGGSSSGGGGPGAAPPWSGPGATLRYAAGGVGSVGSPGAVDWKGSLGQGWSHDYAVRIVEDPDRFHVWLLTEHATFREFTDGDSDGIYETVSPGNEKRALAWTGSGWQLTELDGTVHDFDSGGLWQSTTPPEGSLYATTATYDAGTGKLERVDFPEGRHELFTYGGDGKLESITEVGVDDSTSRTWIYLWASENLVRIERPDGTAWELTYGDIRYPGYMTLMELVGYRDEGGGNLVEVRRVESAWEYDGHGNVVKTWKGDVSFTGPDAVERWQFSFDDPTLPTETTVTDPLGDITIHTFDAGRTSVRQQPKVVQASGGCPACGFASNSQMAYADPVNPYSPTTTIDGEGHTTTIEYDEHGMPEVRMEPGGRTTLWDYHPDFPALATQIDRPSVVGGGAMRGVMIDYDLDGNPTKRTITGMENGAAFSYPTDTEYNAAGQPIEVDPPGYLSAPTDQTFWSYTPSDPLEPDRNGLLPFSRTDPIVGTTAFGYDAFNRQTSVTDPNGIETTTSFDALGRVVEVRRIGNSTDLVALQEYDELGQLFRTTLPRGNVIEYGYDAAGRLITVERKPDAGTPGERLRYELDGFGNRTEEHVEWWNTVSETWEPVTSTLHQYESRCQLASTTRGAGSATPATSHFAYDCDGKLEREWDPNHPRFDPMTQAELPATRTYGYDTLDRLTSIAEPWGGSGGGTATTLYGYDVQDHLTSVTDSEGNQTTYLYSDRDLLTEEASPVSGTTTHVYNEHGELVETEDARGVTVTRAVDPADRPTAIDFADDSLDVSYLYDAAPAACGGSSAPIGRLASIERNGEAVEYCYDDFGRPTRDGDLAFSYDANNNRTSIVYPGGVTATYELDFADRETSLSVTTSAGDVPVASNAAYLPYGPLTAVTLGNDLVESRSFNALYQPLDIAVPAPAERSWDYVTDPVGNILSVTESRTCGTTPLTLTDQTVTTTETFESCNSIEAGSGFAIVDPGDVTLRATERVVLTDGFSVGAGASLAVEIEPVEGSVEILRSYGYQDVQYFLTAADGPWGTLDWTYDTIGNRLSETRNGGNPDSYVYPTHLGGGHTPILDRIDLGIGGSREYSWGLAGHLEDVSAGGNLVDFDSDEDGRLTLIDRPVATATTAFLYDGRSYLRRAEQTAGGTASVEPTYDTSGLLHALTAKTSSTATAGTTIHLYLAGRPVAQLHTDGTTETWTYLTTDHLGTPLLATDGEGEVVWEGGFEPFGNDYQAGTAAGASDNGIFLRLPGQWDDGTWDEASSGAGVYYNVHRWYEEGTGRYTRPDPFHDQAASNAFDFSYQNPLMFVDRDGRFPTGVWDNPLSCASAVTLEARRLGQGRGWRWAHCWGQLHDHKRMWQRVAGTDIGQLQGRLGFDHLCSDLDQ
jgi:RHS repeat-associated protein